MNFFQSLEHHPHMLQMISLIHVMYIDIIYTNLQEVATPIFKNLWHNPKENATNIL
jgi:hypothetical protein